MQHAFPHVEVALVKTLSCVSDLDTIEGGELFAIDIAAFALGDRTEQGRSQDAIRHGPDRLRP